MQRVFRVHHMIDTALTNQQHQNTNTPKIPSPAASRHLPPASVLDEQIEPVQVYRHVGLLEQRHVGGPAAPDDGGHVGGGELQLVGHRDRGPNRNL